MDILYESIAHHGIDGMKWGVRNGPPYPLERYGNGSIKKKKENKNGNKKAVNSKKKSILSALVNTVDTSRNFQEQARKNLQEFLQVNHIMDVQNMINNINTMDLINTANQMQQMSYLNNYNYF